MNTNEKKFKRAVRGLVDRLETLLRDSVERMDEAKLAKVAGDEVGYCINVALFILSISVIVFGAIQNAQIAGVVFVAAFVGLVQAARHRIAERRYREIMRKRHVPFCGNGQGF